MEKAPVRQGLTRMLIMLSVLMRQMTWGWDESEPGEAGSATGRYQGSLGGRGPERANISLKKIIPSSPRGPHDFKTIMLEEQISYLVNI